jgi:hypothetical protein
VLAIGNVGKQRESSADGHAVDGHATGGGDTRLRGDGRQEPAHFESEVRKRKKARMASPV